MRHRGAIVNIYGFILKSEVKPLFAADPVGARKVSNFFDNHAPTSKLIEGNIARRQAV